MTSAVALASLSQYSVIVVAPVMAIAATSACGRAWSRPPAGTARRGRSCRAIVVAPVTYALTAPTVRTTAATAATAGPAVPTARPSNSASGTEVADAGPSTPIVATARPR